MATETEAWMRDISVAVATETQVNVDQNRRLDASDKRWIALALLVGGPLTSGLVAAVVKAVVI